MEQYPPVVDPWTGVLLTPSFHGEKCDGSGDNPEYPCCCDECDFFLYCFPDWETFLCEP